MDEGIHVPAGGDRLREPHGVFDTRRIDYKVLTRDTNGGLFVSQIIDRSKGGPARHLHHEQDEWFYVVEGEYVIAVVLTTNLRLAGAAGNVPVSKENTALSGDSVANVSQVITLDKSFLTERVSRVSDRIMVSVEEGLRTVLAL